MLPDVPEMDPHGGVHGAFGAFFKCQENSGMVLFQGPGLDIQKFLRHQHLYAVKVEVDELCKQMNAREFCQTVMKVTASDHAVLGVV